MIAHETIEIFSDLWWFANITTIFLIAFFIFLGLHANKLNRNKLAQFIGIILLIRTIGIHFYWSFLGIWTIESSLPLHLCGLSAILSSVVLFWRNQLAYEFLFYWGLPGAFHALMTPEFTSGRDGLLFIEYYISHGGILLSALYLTLIFGMKPRGGSWWKIFLYSQLLVPTIGFINWFLEANYMYLCIKPIANNPLLFGEWPWYFLGIEFMALIHYYICYLLFTINAPWKYTE